jgi:enamine deaminase RidA (YjgF/YER057c/UK114 family)
MRTARPPGVGRVAPVAHEVADAAGLFIGHGCSSRSDLIANWRKLLYGWRMTDIRRIDPGPRLSEASIYGDRMYLSGMIPEDTSQDITGQVKQALGEIDALLEKGGSEKTRILSAVIWLADIKDFSAMNAVWDAWVVPGQTPARATVQARLNDPKMKVEIMVVAAR